MAVRSFVAGAEEAGLRLDLALARRVEGLSRSAASELIKSGRVRVGGEVASRPARPLRASEQVEAEVKEPEPSRFEAEPIPLAVVYEDDDLLVIDKPAGLVVHPAAGHRDGTLVNALLYHAGSLAPAEDPSKPGIVHRLDKDTSGLMVVAKTPEARASLERQFQERDVSKTYLAVVHGRAARRGTIDAPIGRDPKDRKRMSVRKEGGKSAHSRYRLLEVFPEASLLEVDIATGRTHQIRVHLQSLGHPVVGDQVYGRRNRVSSLLARFPRQALHAAVLCFLHPRSGVPLRFEAPLPIDMDRLVRELRRRKDPEEGTQAGWPQG